MDLINGVYQSFSWTRFPELESRPSAKIKEEIIALFRRLIEEGELTDPLAFVDRLSRELSLEKIIDMSEEDIPKTVEEMKGLFSEARRYLERVDGQHSWNIRSLVIQVMDALVRLIETVIYTFGVGTLFQPAANELMQEFKSNKLFMVFTMISTVSTLILPLLGAAFAAELIGGFFLAVIVLGLIWPKISPMPKYLPGNAENWTQRAVKNEIEAEGRKSLMDRMAHTLKAQKHVLLVGETGVGKTFAVEAFVKAIERGDYPELRGKQVFYLKTPDLVSQRPAAFVGGGNNILYEIASLMGRHKDDIILVLDEIHAVCKKEALLQEQLKVFLDRGGKFPHVIGITTDREVVGLEENRAFMRRFDRIDVTSASEEESKTIYRNIAIKLGAVVDEVALQRIYQATLSRAQPHAGIELLKRCIECTSSSQQSKTQRDISLIRDQILQAESQISGHFGRVSGELKAQLDDLHQALCDLEGRLEQELYAKEKVFRIKKLLQDSLKSVYRNIVQKNLKNRS
jgi:ATP-dependent Clp protease ATP-binding subunit ClpA